MTYVEGLNTRILFLIFTVIVIILVIHRIIIDINKMFGAKVACFGPISYLDTATPGT